MNDRLIKKPLACLLMLLLIVPQCAAEPALCLAPQSVLGYQKNEPSQPVDIKPIVVILAYVAGLYFFRPDYLMLIIFTVLTFMVFHDLVHETGHFLLFRAYGIPAKIIFDKFLRANMAIPVSEKYGNLDVYQIRRILKAGTTANLFYSAFFAAFIFYISNDIKRNIMFSLLVFFMAMADYIPNFIHPAKEASAKGIADSSDGGRTYLINILLRETRKAGFDLRGVPIKNHPELMKMLVSTQNIRSDRSVNIDKLVAGVCRTCA